MAWLLRFLLRHLGPHGGVMVRWRENWLFVDYYGTVWGLRETRDPAIPLSITLELHR